MTLSISTSIRPRERKASRTSKQISAESQFAKRSRKSKKVQQKELPGNKCISRQLLFFDTIISHPAVLRRRSQNEFSNHSRQRDTEKCSPLIIPVKHHPRIRTGHIRRDIIMSRILVSDHDLLHVIHRIQ